MISDVIVYERIEQAVRDAAEWLDCQIAANLAGLYAAGQGVEHDPRVVKLLRERREQLAAWRAAKLDELRALLLRETNRLN